MTAKNLIDKHLKYDSMSAATSSQPCWSSSVSNRQWSNWAAAEDPVVGPNDDITTTSVNRYSSWLPWQQLSNGSRYSCAFNLQCFRRENKKYCIIYPTFKFLYYVDFRLLLWILQFVSTSWEGGSLVPQQDFKPLTFLMTETELFRNPYGYGYGWSNFKKSINSLNTVFMPHM